MFLATCEKRNSVYILTVVFCFKHKLIYQTHPKPLLFVLIFYNARPRYFRVDKEEQEAGQSATHQK